MRAELIPPLLAYHVAGKHSSAPAIPWSLAGGVTAANCLAAYQPKGAADYAASKVNLANPGTYNCSDGAAYPAWDATNGWQFVTASSQYLNTGLKADTCAKTGSFLSRLASQLGNTAYYTSGASNGSEYFGGWRIRSESLSYPLLYCANTNNTGTDVTGSHVIGGAGAVAYRDGSPVLTVTQSTSSINFDIYIGCTNNSGTAANFNTGNVLAIAYYNTTLSDAQVAAISTAMAAL